MMSMDLDQIAQRLEELSLELNSTELQGLAEAIIALPEKTCPTCQQSAQYRHALNDIYAVMQRHGMAPPESNPNMLEAIRIRMQQRAYYSTSVASGNAAHITYTGV